MLTPVMLHWLMCTISVRNNLFVQYKRIKNIFIVPLFDCVDQKNLVMIYFYLSVVKITYSIVFFLFILNNIQSEQDEQRTTLKKLG